MIEYLVKIHNYTFRHLIVSQFIINYYTIYGNYENIILFESYSKRYLRELSKIY